MSHQYAFRDKSLVYCIYFSLLGGAAFLAGIVSIMVTLTCNMHSFGFIEIPDSGFRGVWGGLVMVFAGIFYLSGIRDSREIHNFAKVVLGSILLWIMAGTDLFAIFAGAVPSTEPGAWLNSAEGFIKAFSGPYTPAIVLFPFSMAVLYYIRKYHKDQDNLFA